MPLRDAVLPTLMALSPRLAISTDLSGSIDSAVEEVFALCHRRPSFLSAEAFDARKARWRTRDDIVALPEITTQAPLIRSIQAVLHAFCGRRYSIIADRQ